MHPKEKAPSENLLDDIKVAKPVKTKAFDHCVQLSDRDYTLTGTVSMREAKMLDFLLALSRKESGKLNPQEYELVGLILAFNKASKP